MRGTLTITGYGVAGRDCNGSAAVTVATEDRPVAVALR